MNTNSKEFRKIQEDLKLKMIHQAAPTSHVWTKETDSLGRQHWVIKAVK